MSRKSEGILDGKRKSQSLSHEPALEQQPIRKRIKHNSERISTWDK
jgi:hypothetical protein